MGVGDRLRLKQGGAYQYYTVASVSYSAPDTTVTVDAGGTALAASAITDNAYSKAWVPQGFTPTNPATVLLASSVLAADATSISFSSIPATYTHLQVIGLARTDRAAEFDGVAMQFNSDTGNNYDYVAAAFSTSAAYAVARATTSINAGRCEANSATANAFTSLMFTIARYAGDTWKSVICHPSMARGDASADTDVVFNVGGGTWKSTAAITTVTLKPLLGTNFKTKTAFYLYGVK